MNNFLNKKIEYKQYIVDSQLRYFKPHATKIEKSFAEEISFSLNQTSKFINPKFFYDKKGSELFESRTGLSIETLNSVLIKAGNLDLLENKNNWIKPTPKGFNFLNELQEFFL